MGRQVIETSTGKFAIFSTNIDDFIGYNATKEDVINFFKDEAAKKAEKDTRDLIETLENGGNPYHQFKMTLEDMMEAMKNSHSKEDYETCKKEIGFI